MKKLFIILGFLAAVLYGANLLYYELTDGFWVSNISSDFAYDPRWETRPLNTVEKKELHQILDQKYKYLGKGCQAYVFASADGKYVIKFFKYQRYKIKPWVEWFSFIPAVEKHKQQRLAHKQEKLDKFFSGWEVAFDELQNETGLVYVHLNKTKDLGQKMVIADKLGFEHEVNLDQTEFLVQKRAVMFTDEIKKLMADGKEGESKKLIDALIGQLLSEYRRGIVDNDHAIMQNTGLIDGKPVHIDVGQFARKPEMADPMVWKQDLFNKTFKFRIWLKDKYPSLGTYVDNEVERLIGPSVNTLKPQLINY